MEREDRNRWNPLVYGCVMMPIALGISVVSAGAGEGKYVLVRVLLPFAYLALGPGHIVWVVLTLAVLQWPLYGLVVSLARNKLLAVGGLLAEHAAVVLWVFFYGQKP